MSKPVKTDGYLISQLFEIQLGAVLTFEHHVDGQDTVRAVKSWNLRIKADEGHRETDRHQAKEEGPGAGQIFARFTDDHGGNLK